MKILLMCLIVAVLVMGCSTAGPFVTNISSDGEGNLIIEKNTVHLNGWTGYLSTGDNPTTYKIRIVPKK